MSRPAIAEFTKLLSWTRCIGASNGRIRRVVVVAGGFGEVPLTQSQQQPLSLGGSNWSSPSHGCDRFLSSEFVQKSDTQPVTTGQLRFHVIDQGFDARRPTTGRCIGEREGKVFGGRHARHRLNTGAGWPSSAFRGQGPDGLEGS